MATEDFNHPPPLPPYPEMIYGALDALNEKTGSNKTSISKYIESRYHNLPAGHSTLLRHHLNKMKDTGELVFWKNNFMRPTPDFIRRGRGRPPKPKVPGPPVSPSRPRGRPRKDEPIQAQEDAPAAVAPPKRTVSSTGRPRGRPRKVPRSNEEDDDAGPRAIKTGSGRPRGRPRKVRPQAEAAAGGGSSSGDGGFDSSDY